MLQRLATALTHWTRRWVPDAWIIAVLLTVITFLLALAFGKHGPYQLIQDWGNGFWVLHTFAMQMALIIMTGYILSASRPVRAALNWLAGIPRNPVQSVGLMALVSMLLAWINWGLSIVGSAVFVRYMVRKQRGVDYGLLVCAAYLGLGGMWHSGLSASAPLLVATPKHFMEKEMGIISVTQTIFTPFNLILAFIVLVVWTFLAMRMHPKPEDTIEADPSLLKEEAEEPKPEIKTFADWIAHTPWVNLFVGLMGLVWLFWNYSTKGFGGITLDSVNFMFLILGILFHWTPASFLKAAAEAGTHVWGVLIQFPFYAGMFGIIRDSGLAQVMANWFTAIATPQTFPLFIYWYSGILNYFVPSGGSKWAIEAPYIVQAALNLKVPLNQLVVTYAWGDMMTDVIQPFWAIPLLGIAKTEFRNIMGYAIVFFIVYFVVTSIAFLIMPYVF
ncbi:short-chain fatty acid transporter [Thermoflexus sp.]|uniref:short-chain fatty acid transporter n=1 Tax=Thermoflexus sp. TaxID=1969742 RepID=UPI0035E40C75